MRSATDQADVAFVIPIVHPDGAKVGNYGVVEAILRETVTSLLAQDDIRPGIVVVCHRLPPWSADLPQVRFMVLPDHPAFAANRNQVRVDKGLKYAMGIWLALDLWGPELVMPMDGDDFVRRDASAHVLRVLHAIAPADRTADAFMLTRGYHVSMRPRAGDAVRGFDVNAVFEVWRFHLTCGSCRMFRSARLRAMLLDALPGLAAFHAADMVDPSGVVRGAFLDAYLDVADPLATDHDGILNILGRHMEQELLTFVNLDAPPLVAKGCGHGNHDGPEAGEVHWHKIRRVYRISRFLREFGLDGRATLRARPDRRTAIAGWGLALKNWIRPPVRYVLDRAFR